MSKIYEPKGRAREYSPLALNIYHGCTHGCVYCYVPKMFRRWNASYDHSECYSVLNEKELEMSAKKFEGCEKQILLSFTGDPYPGTSDHATTRALEILLKYNHKVAILTKGGTRCLKDLELFKKFGNRIKIGATLSMFDEKLSKEWEPGAAMPSDRLKALEILHEEGVTTWASFEPVVYTREALSLIEVGYKFLDHIKIGKLNGMKSVEDTQDWWKFSCDAISLCRESKLPFYIKESLRPYTDMSSLTPQEIDMDYLNV